ncbi:MAG TPA: hypothetical protein VOA87_03445 [Thermoanaerobaculia bacterium]|nr:hypothetical protein [Thermoanaerobaculia bacterium]
MPVARPQVPEPFAVSAPGKLILMGEHSVVYGRPALVAAIDLRLRARFEAGASRPFARGGAVSIDLPGLGAREETDWPAILDYARLCRQRWEGYARNPRPDSFQALRGEDPLHLVKVALGEVAGSFGEGVPLPPLRLRIESDLPVGSGLGSSAAAAVAVVAGTLEFFGAAADLPTVERLAHEVERRQHGTPSGVDAATVLHGGLLWARRRPAGGLDLTPVAVRSPLLAHLRVHDSGMPAEPTGAVVAAVRARHAADPARHERLLDCMGEATEGLHRALAAREERPMEIVTHIREFEAGLEELGVVPPAVRALVRRIEGEGGAAKISGAGALTGPSAGALLVYHPEAERPSSWPFLAALPLYPVHLGAAGLRREAIP